jgi:hypothetical protein
MSLDQYASMDPVNQCEIKDFKLKIASEKIKSASLSFSIASQFIKEGKAT